MKRLSLQIWIFSSENKAARVLIKETEKEKFKPWDYTSSAHNCTYSHGVFHGRSLTVVLTGVKNDESYVEWFVLVAQGDWGLVLMFDECAQEKHPFWLNLSINPDSGIIHRTIQKAQQLRIKLLRYFYFYSAPFLNTAPFIVCIFKKLQWSRYQRRASCACGIKKTISRGTIHGDYRPGCATIIALGKQWSAVDNVPSHSSTNSRGTASGAAYALKRLMSHKMNGDITAGYIVTDVERLRKPMQQITDYFLKCIWNTGQRKTDRSSSHSEFICNRSDFVSTR